MKAQKIVDEVQESIERQDELLKMFHPDKYEEIKLAREIEVLKNG